MFSRSFSLSSPASQRHRHNTQASIYFRPRNRGQGSELYGYLTLPWGLGAKQPSFFGLPWGGKEGGGSSVVLACVRLMMMMDGDDDGDDDDSDDERGR